MKILSLNMYATGFKNQRLSHYTLFSLASKRERRKQYAKQLITLAKKK